MRRRTTCSIRLGCLALLLCAGCSLTPDGDPLRPRLFSPEQPPEAFQRQTPRTGPELRLGYVRSAEHLGKRIALREGPVVGFYELRRWAESPVVFLERALRRHAFHDPAAKVRRTLSADAATVDLMLLSFEEVRPADGSVPTARVAVGYVLLQGAEHRAEGIIRHDEPLASAEVYATAEDTAPLLALATGRALDRSVAELVDVLERHLSQ